MTEVRRWTIILRSGANITFDAAWNWIGDNGPKAMMDHFRDYLTNGSKPQVQKPYVFPEANNTSKKAAEIAVDIADVQAIVQVSLGSN